MLLLRRAGRSIEAVTPAPPVWVLLALLGVSGLSSRAHAAPRARDIGDDGRPQFEARPTVWALAGARSWVKCREMANAAAAQAPAPPAGEASAEEALWFRHAKRCPQTPEILSLVARIELLRVRKWPTRVDETTDLDALEAEVHAGRMRALELLDRISAEKERRGDTGLSSLEHWRGKALLAEGRYAEADRAFARCERGAGLHPARVRRMRAVVALFQGDLDRARKLAYRAWIDSQQGSALLLSAYVYALVLERSGDRRRARRLMDSTLRADHSRTVARALLGVLPLHEHIYFRALVAEALRDGGAASGLWRAYLARAEPEDPERRLAERRLEALVPRPDNRGDGHGSK